MQKLLQGLVNSFFRSRGKTPSSLFITSSERYLEPGICAPLEECEMEKMIKARSYRAYLIYRRMRKNSTITMLCYVLINICNGKQCIVEELNRNIRRGALGFEVSYFTEANIILLRERIDVHLHGIMFQVYQNACIYRKLRSISSFHSKAHMNFYELVRIELEKYERCVVEQEEELLPFYTGMYPRYIRLHMIHQLNECFNNSPKKPFDFLKLNLHLNHSFYGEVLKTSCMHVNTCLREFMTKGDFSDSNMEFFICKNVGTVPWDSFSVDFGLVPYFMSNKTVERILYIGKCVALMRDRSARGESHFEDTSMDQIDINILDPNFEDDVDVMLRETNERVRHALLDELNVYEQIEGARRTFLFGRCDFIETLFFFLRDTKRVGRKSFSYILDAAIKNTYGGVDGFTSKLGVYLVDNESKYENFALFCQLDDNLVFTKEVVLKLVAVFQFLWRLKRVEHLLLRLSRTKADRHTGIKIVLYTNLVYKISYFMFEEVISKKWRFKPSNDGMPLNDLKSGLERVLNEIMGKGCAGGVIEKFLCSLEGALMSFGMGTPFNDTLVQETLKDLLLTTGEELAGTLLFDLHKYMTINKTR